jgi:hypothetical protein
MNARTLSRLSLVALTALLLVSAGSALTAANTVPVTHAGVDTRSIGPNDLKPSPCAGITLTRLVTSSGTFSGTSANELILAGATTASRLRAPAEEGSSSSASSDCPRRRAEASLPARLDLARTGAARVPAGPKASWREISRFPPL